MELWIGHRTVDAEGWCSSGEPVANGVGRDVEKFNGDMLAAAIFW
jgi:hypothetical protein